jgi:hypothetical protein
MSASKRVSRDDQMQQLILVLIDTATRTPNPSTTPFELQRPNAEVDLGQSQREAVQWHWYRDQCKDLF